MATFLRASGEAETLTPANGTNWTLPELQTLVGGFIEIAQTKDDKFLVLDEEGKLKGKPINEEATRRYRFGKYDPLVGDVLIIDTCREMDGDEDGDDDA